MIYKIVFIIVAIVVLIYGATYVFNHINPWAGQGLGLIGGVLILVWIVSIIKTEVKKTNEEQ